VSVVIATSPSTFGGWIVFETLIHRDTNRQLPFFRVGLAEARGTMRIDSDAASVGVSQFLVSVSFDSLSIHPATKGNELFSIR
jgi:hypothetical protein